MSQADDPCAWEPEFRAGLLLEQRPPIRSSGRGIPYAASSTLSGYWISSACRRMYAFRAARSRSSSDCWTRASCSATSFKKASAPTVQVPDQINAVHPSVTIPNSRTVLARLDVYIGFRPDQDRLSVWVGMFLPAQGAATAQRPWLSALDQESSPVRPAAPPMPPSQEATASCGTR